ncbi:MAG: TetR family transcriptional regulator C-terminal domain-containing protein, partial [Phascolarctobacterium sp.]|nr:TetR family transcriptional regulator C-terminal domain-containing protein [Phascolarctobacterium sp.]
LPKDYVINHIASCFVETVEWWLQNNTQESPEEITEYFLTTTRQFL